MAFPFTLPTTSILSLTTLFTSPTYPSLPLSTTTHRAVFRDALKRYKRLTPQERAIALPSVLSAVEDYIPYLFLFDQAFRYGDVVPTEPKEVETEWRPTLSKAKKTAVVNTKSLVGGEAPRVRRGGLNYELAFVVATLGYTHTLRARTLLASALYSPSSAASSGTGNSTEADRMSASAALINQAIAQLLTSASVFTYLHDRAMHTAPIPPNFPADLTPAVTQALTHLSMAAATLLAVLKSDPYPSFVALEHDKNNREWMYKAPTVPTGVTALMLVRLCVEASDLAGKALGNVISASSSSGSAAGGTVSPELRTFCEKLRNVGRAKACRFMGISAEAQGKVGEAIGWVRAGRETLGFRVDKEGEILDDGEGGGSGGGSGGSSSGFEKFRKAREERKEGKKWEKQRSEGLLGDDSGRFEEGRVLAALEKKWVKVNDSVMFQPIKSSASLLGQLPSGRSVHPDPKPWVPPTLSAETMATLQAKPSEHDLSWQADRTIEEDSDDEILRPGTTRPDSGKSHREYY